MKLKAINLIDFYKSGHKFQYPEGTELVYSNFTARSDCLAAHKSELWDSKVVFYGLQGVIQWLLIDLFNDTFFKVSKEQAVGEYKRIMDKSLGEGLVPADHIAALHDLGYLPVLIKALPEGSRVNIGVPVFTVSSTLPEFYWLTNYLEDVLSSESWKSITTATVAYEYRRTLDHYAELTGSPMDFVPWQGHDFSFRGVGGVYDAAQSNSGHLLSFLGTDTLPAIDYLEEYYGGKDTFIGGSVPATEHSVMCMGGKEDETETFRRLIEDTYPSGVISVVSDTWNLWEVVGGPTSIMARLKDKILARQPNSLGLAKAVVRPDSGDPVDILCGYKIWDGDEKEYKANIQEIVSGNYTVHKRGGKYHFLGNLMDSDDCVFDLILADEISEWEAKGVIECLWDIFGGTRTAKDFKVLNQRVGAIYGDSITLGRLTQIEERLMDKGFASCNVVFGIGSYTYQYATRDTYGFAMKATYGIVNGVERELFKDPITDSGTKKSAKGLLRVEKVGNDFVLHDQQTSDQEAQGELQPVFKDGKLLKFQTIEEIRARLLGS
jgi:nicotinamide phosphoribosyltransferase